MSGLNCSEPRSNSFRSSMSLFSLSATSFCLRFFRRILFPSAKRSYIPRSLLLKSPSCAFFLSSAFLHLIPIGRFPSSLEHKILLQLTSAEFVLCVSTPPCSAVPSSSNFESLISASLSSSPPDLLLEGLFLFSRRAAFRASPSKTFVLLA